MLFTDTEQIHLTENMETETPGTPAFALIDRVDPGSPAGQGVRFIYMKGSFERPVANYHLKNTGR